MTAPLFYAMPGNEDMAARLALHLKSEVGILETRNFPDGETYLKFVTSPQGRSIAIVCTLDDANRKILPLLFAAVTARELGATRVGLIAPYLAYMRQDKRFNAGEAVSSRPFARLLSGMVDWLVTVDPHLHRYAALGEIYSIPSRTVHAAPLVSQWITSNVADPVIVGPDSESEQWVSAVALAAAAPFTVLEKVRHGDRKVDISLRHPERLRGKTPVLLDDIIASGVTMLEAVKLVRTMTAAAPVCVGVHGLFADASDRLLSTEGARVVTSNTVPHASNMIDVSPLLADAVRELLG